MKSILEGREGLKAVVYQIAEVTGYLWQKGWAERNGGNITVNVTEYMDDECKAMKAISEVKQIGMVLPQPKGKYFRSEEWRQGGRSGWQAGGTGFRSPPGPRQAGGTAAPPRSCPP